MTKDKHKVESPCDGLPPCIACTETRHGPGRVATPIGSLCSTCISVAYKLSQGSLEKEPDGMQIGSGDLCCSLCHKSRDQVKMVRYLAIAQESNGCICEECLLVCLEILREDANSISPDLALPKPYTSSDFRRLPLPPWSADSCSLCGVVEDEGVAIFRNDHFFSL